MARVGLLAAFVAALAAVRGASASASHWGIIQTSGTTFVDTSCNSQFVVNGWNGWQALLYAADRKTPSGFSSGKDYISSMFSKAGSLGMNVFRAFVQGDETWLYKSDGTFDSGLLDALDWMLDEAAANNVRVSLILNNLWKDDGIPLFEELCGTSGENFKPDPSIDPRAGTTLNASERIQTPYSWLTDKGCQEGFQTFVSGVVERTNGVNGLAYVDDPTIFSWVLLNEPRCKYCGGQPVADWYALQAEYLRSIDAKHMITTGEEGFFGAGNSYSSNDPDDSNHWALLSGQHFVADHSSDAISYATIHMWPGNWGIPDDENLAFAQNWVATHNSASGSSLGKPLVMEEFGVGVSDPSLIADQRDPIFQAVYGAASESASGNSRPSALQGAAMWIWSNLPTRVSDTDILFSDSTFTDIITPFGTEWAAANATCASSPTGAPSTAAAEAPSAATPSPTSEASPAAPATSSSPATAVPVVSAADGSVPPPPPAPLAILNLLG